MKIVRLNGYRGSGKMFVYLPYELTKPRSMPNYFSIEVDLDSIQKREKK